MADLEDVLRKNTPLEDFDRDRFVPYFEAYDKVQEKFDRLKENPNDFDAEEDLSVLLFGDPRVPNSVPQETIKRLGHSFLVDEKKAMAAYAEHNLNTLIREMTDKEVLSLALSNPGITGISKEHDKIAEMVNEYLEIQRAGSSIEGMVRYVNKKAEKHPMWFRRKCGEAVAQAIFSTYRTYYENKLEGLFMKKDGKIDRKKAEKFYRDNIKKIKDEYNDEPNEGDKGDIRKDELDERYVAAARVLYPRLKGEKKMDDDEDREIRKAERAQYHMAA